MNINGSSLFGNEWIKYDKKYLKILVSEDGIYRISKVEMANAGFPINSIKGRELMLIHFGEEIPIYVSAVGNLSDNDFIEFFGKRNDGELDKQLFDNWQSEQLNPLFSNYTDNSTYYLTWEDESDNNKRITTVTNNIGGNLPSPVSHYLEEEKIIFSDFHNSPAFTENVRYSHYYASEGFGTKMQATNVANFSPTNIYNQGDSPYIVCRVGRNNGAHNTELFVNNDFKVSDQTSNFNVEEFTIPLNVNELSSSTKLKVESTASSIDRNSIGYASLFYPRLFKANNTNEFQFDFPASGSDLYFEVDDFQSNANVFLYDVNNNRRMVVDYSNNTTRFLIPASNKPSSHYIYETAKTPNSLVTIEIENEFVGAPDYIILTSKELNSNATGPNQIAAYSSYRSSDQGGGHKVRVVEVESLYDQFSYGIEGHCQAIKNFSNYIKGEWPQINYIFIIGKGIEYNYLRLDQSEVISHVPVFGIPGADNLLLGKLNHDYPVFPTGRLAVRDAKDIEAYLNKIKEHENYEVLPQNIEGLQWRKNVIHLSGGSTQGEQDQIFSGLEVMRNVLENNYYGAKVTSFRKTSSSSIQTTVSQQIIDKINEGTSIINFFGHSAVGTFDFSIEDPEKYDNFGKYPLMISLGCNAGNIHTTSTGISEKFVLAQNRGSLGFLAASGVANIANQDYFGRTLYEFAGGDFYGGSIGEMIKTFLVENETTANNLYVRSFLEQITLHADPAMKLPAYEGPDYIVDYATVRTEPTVVNSTLDSFDIAFDIVNLGKGVEEPLFYQVIHSYGNQIDTIIGATIGPENRKTIRKKVENKGLKGLGKNVIDIVLDYNNIVDEYPAPEAELNNRLSVANNVEGYCFFVFDTNAQPIYPKEFSIVTENEIRFLASANNAFLEEYTYIMELDTTQLFDSPLKVSIDTKSLGGMIEWKPSFNYVDGQEYFWRIRNVDSEESSEIWSYSSFIYLPNESNGWNQSHLYQWLRDDFNKMKIDSQKRVLELGTAIGEYRVENRLRLSAESKPQYFFNNQFKGANDDKPNGNGVDINAGVYVIVADKESTEPWKNAIGGSYGTEPGNYSYEREMFAFGTFNEINRAEVTDFVQNVVPDGHLVILMTIQSDEHSYQPEKWDDDQISLFDVFEQEGATQIRSLENGPVPYVFAYIKGDDPTVASEYKAANVEEDFSVLIHAEGLHSSGNVYSTVIGPAQKWSTFEWNIVNENNVDDIYSYNIVGIKEDGQKDTLVLNETIDLYDLSSIDGNVYPYLQLVFNSSDASSFTSAHIDFWRVYYKEVPESVLNPNVNFSFESDTLFRGRDFKLNIQVDNITNQSMDSLLVMYTIVDNQNNAITELKKYPPLLANDHLTLDYSRSTGDLKRGVYELRVEVNPAMDQIEQYLFNNLGFKNFLVREDDLNPLLNVKFDGIRIMNRDIVSPTPLISVHLKDDNPFELLNDKEDFELTLLFPDGTTENVDINAPIVEFFPAQQGGDNEARLEYSPSLSAGIYSLIVQAKDKSGNFSGDHAYQVEFEVVEENSISDVLNYPNPFSTSTQFIFTLTGKDIPDDFVIRIMTLSGKVVKEITQSEYGPLHAGVNRSSYKWDGKDEFGSELANGVYIYKLFLAPSSDPFNDYYIQQTEDYFKNGFGKLVILR